MKRIKKTAVCAGLGIALIMGLCACGAASPAPAAPSVPAGNAPGAEPEAGITVSASSTVRLVPDKATISFGVTTQEPTAELAQSKNSEAVNNVIDVLTGQGVEEKSIRTTNYNMYPQYDYSEGGEQRIIGYIVYTTMSVQDQDIEDLSTLLSACVAAGINHIDNISFLCSGYDEAYRQALTQAVTASREKAETLAAAAGKALGDVVSITEGWQDTSARYGKNATSAMAFSMEDAKAAGPSIQPGETEISASVTVTYRMK